MKRIITMLFFCNIQIPVFCQADTFIINKTVFVAKKELIKTDFDRTDTLLQFFRIKNKSATFLFSHYLFSYAEDCNNEFTDIGKFKVKDNLIILETKTFQKGSDPIPANRIRIYKVSANGIVRLVSDTNK